MAEDSSTARMLAMARARDSGEVGQWASQAAAAPVGEAASRALYR